MLSVRTSHLCFILMATAVGFSSCNLIELNEQIQAEQDQIEKSTVLVKALEELVGSYAAVNILDLTVQIQKPSPLSFDIMENFNSVMKNLKLKFSQMITVNQPKPKKEVINVWIVDGYTNFRKIYLYAEANTRNKPGIYFIVLYQMKMVLHLKKVQRIFKRMFELNILNILVMLKVRKEKHIIYGYNPFTSEHCRKVEPFIVKQFPNGSLINNNVWPNEIKNFHQCPMVIYTWHKPPFMMIDRNEKGNNIFGGIEGKMLRVIAFRLNLTIHLLTDKAFFYGDIDENGDATGPFMLLQKKYVDILMGSYFSSATRTRSLSETRTYMVSKLVAIVKKIHNSYKYAKWIIDPFTGTSWLFIIIYTMKVFGLILFLTPPTERSGIFLKCFASFLGISQHLIDTRKKFCFTIAIWTFGFLILRCAYQAEIYHAYRTSHDTEPPKSFDEVVARGYKIYSSRLYSDSASGFDVESIGLTNGALVVELLERDVENQSAGVVSYPRLLYYVLNKHKHDLYDIVPQPLYLQQSCAYFQRHSYLTRPFDNLIAKMRSTGLLQKWSLNRLGHGWDMHFKYTEVLSKLPQPMTIYKLKWLFVVLMLLHFLAICVFILEVWMVPNSINSNRKFKTIGKLKNFVLRREI